MTQAPHGGSEHPVELNHVHGHPVGQGTIGLGPDVFRRIELRRVGRELFHVESWMGGDPRSDFFTAMDRSPIPEQDDGSLQMPEQVLQERSDIQAGEIVTAQPKVERHPSPLGRHGQGTDRRHPILLIAVAHDRRAAFRGPGVRHVGDEQEARFIKEDEVGTTSRGVFYMGPAYSRPPGDGRIVPLQGSAFGFLTTPSQTGQELPDMTGMVAHPELLADHLGDTP